MITVDAISIIFFLILTLFLFLYIFVNYQAPDSYRIALKDTASVVLIYCTIIIVVNLIQFGLAFEKWRWAMLAGVAIAALLRLAVDGVALHNRKKSNIL